MRYLCGKKALGEVVRVGDGDREPLFDWLADKPAVQLADMDCDRLADPVVDGEAVRLDVELTLRAEVREAEELGERPRRAGWTRSHGLCLHM
jgi:hypothetical protein